MTKSKLFTDLKEFLRGYFDLSKDLDDEKMATQSIMDGVSFKGSNIVILIIAIFIASLGLNTNSAAVIIGAMLISPLMGPIIGMGFGLGTYNFDLIKRSFRNIAMAAGFSVLASTIYFLISPVSEGRSELLARTSPTIYDVFIGFFGGLAGIVALACKQKGNVLPGVAIATALMPPLCTAGYGLATWQLHYFFGAFYLFLINSIFIAFATTMGVKFLKFPRHAMLDADRQKKVHRIVYTILTLTLLPSIWLTFLMLRENYFVNDANNFITKEISLPNTQIFNKSAYIKDGEKYIDVTLIGEKVNTDSLKIALAKKIDSDPTLRGTVLQLQQGFGIGMVGSKDNTREITSSMFKEIYADNQRKIGQQANKIDSLQRVLKNVTEFERLSKKISPELKVLFPAVQDLALSRNVFCDTRSERLDTVDMAIIKTSGRMSATEQTKLIKYLEVRSNVKSIKLVHSNDLK